MSDKPEKRQILLMLRLTRAEREELDEAARAESLPTGTWVRSTAVRAARDKKRAP